MVTRRHAREVFADLSPDKLYWIEFWGTGREVVYLQTGMLSYEDLNSLALMNRMVIPIRLLALGCRGRPLPTPYTPHGYAYALSYLLGVPATPK
jgi:hypothetical protein